MGTDSGNVVDVGAFVRRKGVCSRKVHLQGQLRLGRTAKETYQVYVVLDNVPLERVERQAAVAEGHDERVAHEFIPHGLDVRPVEEIFYEIATTESAHASLKGLGRC